MSSPLQFTDELQSLLKLLPIPACVHHIGIVRAVNPVMLDLLGYETEAELKGTSMLELVHPDDRAMVTEAIRKGAIAKNENTMLSTRAIKKSGETILLESKSVTVHFNGEDCRMVVISNYEEADVLKSELLEKEKLLQHISNIFPDFMMVAESHSRKVLFQNRPLTELLGYETKNLKDEEYVRFLYSLLHPDDVLKLDEARDRVDAMSGADMLSTVEYRLRDSQGRWRWLRSRTKPYRRDQNENIALNFNITQDVTHEKEIEEALIQSKLFAEKIAQSLPHLITVLNPFTFERVYTNLNETKFLGYDTSTIPYNIFDVIVADSRGFAMRKLKEVLSLTDGEVLNTVLPWVDLAGKVHHVLTRAMVFQRDADLKPELILIASNDISDLKQIQQELDNKVTEMQRYIESNIDLERFAYIASHDLREPIRSIMGFAQLLQKRNRQKLDADSNQFLESIIGSAQRMNELVQGLLDYSRISHHQSNWKAVSLDGVLEKVQADMIAAIQENHAEVLFDSLPEIFGDELQLRQLFQNLISNSVKFRREENPRIEIGATRESDRWLITYSDNGIGFDMKYKDRVFQIFTRLVAGEKFDGTGIGLALCRKIVERHHGKISVESTPGRGTTFKISLPART